MFGGECEHSSEPLNHVEQLQSYSRECMDLAFCPHISARNFRGILETPFCTLYTLESRRVPACISNDLYSPYISLEIPMTLICPYITTRNLELCEQ